MASPVASAGSAVGNAMTDVPGKEAARSSGRPKSRAIGRLEGIEGDDFVFRLSGVVGRPGVAGFAIFQQRAGFGSINREFPN
jgi:hypothetical protein